MDHLLYLLFCPAILAILVILVIYLRDTFTSPKPQAEPEEAAPAVAPAMTPTEVQA